MNCLDAITAPLSVLESYGCGARRRRLIACAVLRLCWHDHANVINRAVRAAELFADDPHDGNLEQAHELVSPLISMSHFDASDLAAYATLRDGDLLWSDLADLLTSVWPAWRYRDLKAVIDDFCMPGVVAWRWHRLPPPVAGGLGGVAKQLTLAAYEHRDADGLLENDRLAVLADALQDDGFRHEATLDHLRSRGRHFQGCWSLDWLLGKEK